MVLCPVRQHWQDQKKRGLGGVIGDTREGTQGVSFPGKQKPKQSPCARIQDVISLARRLQGWEEGPCGYRCQSPRGRGTPMGQPLAQHQGASGAGIVKAQTEQSLAGACFKKDGNILRA